MKVNTILQKTFDNSNKDSINIITDVVFDGYTATVDTYINDSDMECYSKLNVKSNTSSLTVMYDSYQNKRNIVGRSTKNDKIPLSVVRTVINAAIDEAKKAGRGSICGMIKALV